MSIYRKEALEYQRVRLSGTVSLVADWRTAQFALAFLFFFSLAAFVFFRAEVSVSAPLQCSLASASKVQFRTSSGIDVKGRLESVEIEVGGRTFVIIPVLAPVGQPMYADLKRLAGPAGEQSCRATGHFVLNPGQLILTKLLKKS
jgi:hypothetical protein